jgi:hypothetical protein
MEPECFDVTHREDILIYDTWMVWCDTERGYLNLWYQNGLMWHREGIFKSMIPEGFDVTQREYLNLWDLNGLMWHREGIFKPMIPECIDVHWPNQSEEAFSWQNTVTKLG